MAYHFAGRQLEKVAVIGSGQIGPDIALHFAKSLAAFGVAVVVVDVSEAALQAGLARTLKKIDKGTETAAWKPAQAEAMKAALSFTSDYAQIAGAGLVVEAATEEEGLKGRIFRQVEGLVAKDAILLSNSSHLEPERIFAALQDQGRTAVAHYFFPAERNPVVEVVSSPQTDRQLSRWLMRFYEAIGKIPIAVKSRYGYAADPIFEGIFQAACLCVEEGLGSVKEVDFAAREALGMTVGPFTAMNLTGGNPITEHGLDLMHQRFATPEWPTPWYLAPQLLKDKLESSGPTGKWEVCGRGETAELAEPRKSQVIDALRGAYLGLCFGILDTGIVNLGDYELCLETALDLTGPCRLANRLGLVKALGLVEQYAALHPSMAVPHTLKTLASQGNSVVVPVLTQEDVAVQAGPGQAGVVRVVAIRRPKVLNALDHGTYQQLEAALAAAEADPQVLGVVLSGAGAKAFVSGADIKALGNVKTPADGYSLSRLGQDTGRKVELLTKPVVAALNGLAFGGGFELALACHARVAVAGQKALVGLPEVNLGIIPGAGGTQRLPRLIGAGKALPLLRTGAPLSSDQALALGIVASLHPADQLIDAAIQLVADAAAGRVTLPKIHNGATAFADSEPAETDIAHRSRAVDAILTEVVQRGLTLPLDAALEAECRAFEQVCGLRDMQIGVQNFLTTGGKQPANFVHS